eukprot:gene687-2878_t
MKVDEAEKSKPLLLCSLVIDEITIRKHISWYGYSFRCYVDVGNGIQDDSSPVVKNALVFMAVSINGSWKVPCAYFLIGGLTTGLNNNPTAQQFTAAYKRLLTRSCIQSGEENCKKLDPTDILHLDFPGNTSVTVTNAALMRKYDLQERSPMQTDHDYTDIPYFARLSQYKCATVAYIVGYVGKMAEMQLLWKECCKALGSKTHTLSSEFIEFKDRGGLFKPIASVVKVCKDAERCFDRMLTSTEGEVFPGA